MKKEYDLTGMSCWGCVNSVRNTILKLTEIQEAEVGLNPQRAILTMNKNVDIAELQAQLKTAGNYTIRELASN
ncbi:MAG: heavy-metal-associated domain-containing protein [Saprospiraceae bacterium]|nr:heavy-metal-associated domain-containing protein [Saprospiraceae bacterium]